MEAQLKTERYRVRGMHCANCALTIEREVRGIPGVNEANVNFAAETLTVRAQPSTASDEIERRVAQAGYLLLEQDREVRAGESALDRGEARNNLAWVLVSAAATGLLMYLAMVPAERRN